MTAKQQSRLQTVLTLHKQGLNKKEITARTGFDYSAITRYLNAGENAFAGCFSNKSHPRKSFDLGLDRMLQQRQPGERFSHRQIAAQCGVTYAAVFLVEQKALRKLRMLNIDWQDLLRSCRTAEANEII